MPNNESSELRLGTEVKIIGPSRGGDSRHTGEEFEISQIDISKSHGEFYSCEGFSWYPASSLRLMPKFTKGDRVYCEHGESVICPGNWIDKKTGTVNDPDYITGDGIKCVIVDWDDKSKRTSVLSSNLRLMEDGLKIGDWVEIVGEPCKGKTVDSIFQIENINHEMSVSRYPVVSYSARKQADYPASSLRKLTPEEIKQHIAASKIKQFDGEIAHLLVSVQECLIESGDVEARAMCREMKINDRLSAIEHRQEAQQKWLSQLVSAELSDPNPAKYPEWVERKRQLELIK